MNMKVDELIKQFILENPIKYVNKFGVLEEVFFEGGCGLHWKGGELEFPWNRIDQDWEIKYSMKNLILEHLDSISSIDLSQYVNNNQSFGKVISYHEKEMLKAIDIIFGLEYYSKDMSIYTIDSSYESKGYKQSFYEIYENCLLCTIPDDITDDWLQAADDFVFTVENNLDRVDPRTSRNQFEKVIKGIRTRINEIKNLRSK